MFTHVLYMTFYICVPVGVAVYTYQYMCHCLCTIYTCIQLDSSVSSSEAARDMTKRLEETEVIAPLMCMYIHVDVHVYCMFYFVHLYM